MKISTFRLTELLLKQYDIIQVYEQIIIQKERTEAEVADRREALDNLRQSNLEKDIQRQMREEEQTRQYKRDLIEGIRKEEEAAKAKRDLKELEVSLKRDMKEMEVSLRRDMKEMDLKFESKFRELEMRLTIKMGAITSAVVGFFYILEKFF